jgi:hypothetical protein
MVHIDNKKNKEKEMKERKKLIFHGEVFFKQVDNIPEGKEKKVEENYLVVGESETHGNDHRVAVLDKSDVKFVEDKDGKLYMINTKDTSVFCPKRDKHSDTVIKKNKWKIGHAREVDHLTEKIREVRD